jgi:hypothetical protein
MALLTCPSWSSATTVTESVNVRTASRVFLQRTNATVKNRNSDQSCRPLDLHHLLRRICTHVHAYTHTGMQLTLVEKKRQNYACDGSHRGDATREGARVQCNSRRGERRQGGYWQG